ncbi:MAG: PLP-dependent transferase [Planctomycetes bacterium]|nr:PLP-dependent transferase [Planctomycetota bacterium]MCB9903093.1 PLP-dependent transferase [Planctomycetota bacterium]
MPLTPLEGRAELRDALAFATRSIHGGPGPDPTTGAILTPIHQSTTYVQEEVGRHKGFTYSRDTNPTVAALERALGSLEGTPPAVCTATGMAATSVLCLATLEAGDRVVLGEVVYGGTFRLLAEILSRFDVRVDRVDSSDPNALRAALREPARLVIVESPANPTLGLCDLAAAAEAAHAGGALLVVDNTFMTPALQSPLEFGADVVLYSTTKSIEGHNATLGGALLSRDSDLLECFRSVRKTLGAPQSPFEAWLTLRGLKTLELRMARHSSSALQVARYLAKHPSVARVANPFLEDFPQRELARRQQRDGGGMIALELEGGTPAVLEFLRSTRLFSLAENLGAAESLVTHPATMTHGSVPPAERERLGLGDGLVRLSVGLEDPNDLIADLARALAAAGGAR